MVLGAIALIALLAYMINFTIVHVERTTFHSTEEMRKAMQGRYAIEHDYEDIYIEGDDIRLTYLAYTHYNREYAERYGYNYDEEDSVYEDHIVKWDYRNGVIKTRWMGDIIVDKDGNIRRGDSYYGTFFKTDKPRPEPIDPSTLKTPEGSINADIYDEEEEEFLYRSLRKPCGRRVSYNECRGRRDDDVSLAERAHGGHRQKSEPVARVQC